jgi:hypothetical protein
MRKEGALTPRILDAVRALTTRETVDVARRQGYAPSRDLRDLPAEPVEGVAEPMDLVVLQEKGDIPHFRP